MKSSKLTEEKRIERRNEIEFNRVDMIRTHAQRGVTYAQSKSTRKVFGKNGKVSHSHAPYPHSSTRQRARYARQNAA